MSSSEPVTIKCTKTTKTKLAHLPCQIKYNGKINKAAYLIEKVSNEKDPIDQTTPLRETRFRGRRLVGYDWKIPEGYSGFVLRRMEGNTYEAVYDFDSIRVWKKDTAPTDGECFYKLGTFLTFVNNVRKRIAAEEAQKKDKAIKENPSL